MKKVRAWESADLYYIKRECANFVLTYILTHPHAGRISAKRMSTSYSAIEHLFHKGLIKKNIGLIFPLIKDNSVIEKVGEIFSFIQRVDRNQMERYTVRVTILTYLFNEIRYVRTLQPVIYGQFLTLDFHFLNMLCEIRFLSIERQDHQFVLLHDGIDGFEALFEQGFLIFQIWLFLVHPTFRVMRQSCRANNLSLKYFSSLNP